MILRGEIYLADLKNKEKHLLQKIRPVIIISNNIGNYYSDIITVVCLSTKKDKTKQPTHLYFKNIDGLKPSLILCEQIFTINKNQLIERIGKMNYLQMQKINQAIKITLNLLPD